MEANDLCFLRPAFRDTKDDLGETVEVMIKDSKTGPGRHAAFVSETQGSCQVKGARIVRNWLRLAGVPTVLLTEGGYHVEVPNYWVARVSVASMSKIHLSRFLEAVLNTKNEMIAKQSASIMKYAKERHRATTLGEELRYVNVAGGFRLGKDKYDEGLTGVRDWLELHGYGKWTSLVPGPLIRATLGKVLTHMPLSTGSTYTHLVSAISEAYEISKEMSEPDPEFDLQGASKPKWGNHSLRRHSDKVARESIDRHSTTEGEVQVTKQVIDYFFGWLLKERNKDMQMHYAGLDKFARRGLARVTMFL